uniref:Complement component 1 Q subcomponent-binding protein, mitochondrial n=1 Tax=Anolis carolinensis TaxID=28377 RepID=A0A803TAV8_ANOCA
MVLFVQLCLNLFIDCLLLLFVLYFNSFTPCFLLGLAPNPNWPRVPSGRWWRDTKIARSQVWFFAGDKAFAEFLMDEIKEEKKIQKHKSLPKMSGGWELDIQGTEAKLARKVAGETITVSFNINNSIPPSFDEAPEGQKPDEQEPDLTSTPNFVVEVTKDDTKQTLVLDCHYPEDEVGHGEAEEEESDIFSIREVSFQPTGESEWRENSYTLNTDSLDWALYDHLMDFLADRGVDNTFADELVDLSTALEHQEYIRFLEELKRFVKCQ